MTLDEFNQIKESIPEQPGIYRYYDSSENLLYVGKAKNILKRVTSYFTKTKYESARLRVLVNKISRIECTVVYTEQDAFLLENNLIKEYQPRYNIQLKDDKTYPYVCINKEPFPRVHLTRDFVRDGSEYFGPYTSVGRVKYILDLVRKIYPLRTCNLFLSQKNILSGKFKVCLEFHIGNCLGPCVNKQSEEDYLIGIQSIRKILKGDTRIVISELEKRMHLAAENFEFETANRIKERIHYLSAYESKSTIVNPKLTDLDVLGLARRDNLAFVHYFRIVNGAIISARSFRVKAAHDDPDAELLSSVMRELILESDHVIRELVVQTPLDADEFSAKITVPPYGDKKNLLSLAIRNADLALRNKLIQNAKTKSETPAQKILKQVMVDLRMKDLPVHIECFDNSNIQGTNAVSACVVFKNARPSKKDYRHFNIKSVEGPNDFASMTEVVFRRYKRLLDEGSPLPQLVVIDGGKGQLSAAKSALEDLGIYGSMVIIGIAKRLEELYFPEDQLPLYIDKKSVTLRLIQQMRDEAHRFGISFHRQKRSKSALNTIFNRIPGIGETTRNQLLQHFKTLQAIRSASLQELSAVIGPHRAAKLLQFFTHEEPDT